MGLYNRISALVLAGGQSSRMGQDKALLELAGKPLYRHMISIVNQAGIDSVVVSGNQLPDALVDRIPGRGPLSGIHAALMALFDKGCEGLVVVPVDMPMLSAGLVKALYEYGSQSHRISCYEGFMLPLFIPVNQDVIDYVNLAITSPVTRDYSLYRLHHRLNGGTMPVPEGMERFFSNANTPEEWASCLSELMSLE